MFGRIIELIEGHPVTSSFLLTCVLGVFVFFVSPLERKDVIRFLRFRRLREDRPEPNDQPAPLPSLSYTEDNIDGVVWRWTWFKGGPRCLTPYCTECDHELEENRGEYGFDGTHLHCPKCNSPRTGKNFHYVFAQRAKLEVERRARMLDEGKDIS